MDWEVRGAINVVEACGQTENVEKIVFTSSLTAAVWRENISSENDIDERSWSNQEFCRKLKVRNLILRVPAVFNVIETKVRNKTFSTIMSPSLVVNFVFFNRLTIIHVKKEYNYGTSYNSET